MSNRGMDPVAEKAKCQECRVRIPVDATTCPECTYSPKDTLVIFLVSIGVVFTLTILGAIIGIPMIIAGVMLYSKRGPAKPTKDSLWYIQPR